MATGSVSDRAFSTRAKIDVSGRSFPSVPAFSEEVISEKNPRHWCDLPEHLLLRIFDFLTQDDEKGRDWLSRAGRVCKAWRRVSKDLLLGDTAASRPKGVQMIASEVHDNKTTLATKGDLVEESVVNSASEVEACSKRQRIDSSSLHFPAFSDAADGNANSGREGGQQAHLQDHLTEVGSLAVGSLDASPGQAPNASVSQVDPSPQILQTAVSVEVGTGDNLEDDHAGGCPSSNEGKCRSSYLGGVNFLNNINSIVKNFNMGSAIHQVSDSK